MFKEDKPLRLLIVEDNPGDLVLLKAYLKRAKIPIEIIHTAEQLFQVEEILKENKVDLAFLDLTLPDSTGIDSFNTLQNLLPHIPIIVLSGLTDTQVALEAISQGAQDYLIKGEFDEKLLVKSTKYSIERKKILENLQESNIRYEHVNKATNDVMWEWNYETNTGEKVFWKFLGILKIT
jgi:two-component system, NarL family, sensor histidine kinase UhpB